jgi:hypothetical protein
MKNYLVLFTIFITGCAYNGPEIISLNYPPFINYNTQPLQLALRETDIESMKLEEFVRKSNNRTDLLQALRASQQANRYLYQQLQNPWNGFYLLNGYTP